MANELIILDEDRQWAVARIAELDQAIQALGPEFYDVFNQSSETWHDNAPFDALRDRQSLLDAERQQLRRVLRESLPSVPKQPRGRIGIGSLVTVKNAKGIHHQYKIAGDWTPYAGQRRNGAIVVSAQAPLAQQLLAKRAGEQTDFGTIISAAAK